MIGGPARLWAALSLLAAPTRAYDYFKWETEPVIDYTKDPGLASTVYFLHMRKAAGTAVRQFFRETYQALQCLPPKERKLVHSDQENWRCNHLAFYHVEWHCFVGGELLRLRRAALGASFGERYAGAGETDGAAIAGGASGGGLQLTSPLTHFYPERRLKFITCLRHPIDRLISITWYGESSHGMQYMKLLHRTGGIGTDAQGRDLSLRPEGDHKRTWYRNSIDIAKQMAAENATLWGQWLTTVDQSTVWNYYVQRLAGGSCLARDKGCQLATQCLATSGPEETQRAARRAAVQQRGLSGASSGGGGDNDDDGSGGPSKTSELDQEHPHGCDALFTNDYLFPKPKLGKVKGKWPLPVLIEEGEEGTGCARKKLGVHRSFTFPLNMPPAVQPPPTHAPLSPSRRLTPFPPSQARSQQPAKFGVEKPAPPGVPSPLARWVDRALGQPCDKHSHKTVHFQNRTRRDLEDAKATLAMFDAVSACLCLCVCVCVRI